MNDLVLLPHAGLTAPLDPPPVACASRADQDRYLRAAFRHHSRTFSLATRLLRREVRLPVAVVYLYCRTVDTIADQRARDHGVRAACRELDEVEQALAATFEGHPPADALLWTRLAEVDAQYGLLRVPFWELLEGARWDLAGRPIQTTDDLLAYANLVAGSVGAMTLPFLVDDRAALRDLEPAARSLGNAMQVTNILRDVGEDWHTLGRVYLPADRMAHHGVTPEVLDAGRPTAAYCALMEELMAVAEGLFRDAEPGIRALPRAARLGVWAAARMYREILNEVRAACYDNLQRRGVVPLGRKLRRVVYDGYGRRRQRLAWHGPSTPSPLAGPRDCAS